MNTATTHPAPEEIMAFFDHELAPELATSVSQHIHDCSECSAALSSITSTSRSLHDWNAPSISPALSKRILSFADAANSGSRKPSLSLRTGLWTWKHWTAGAVSAGLVILVMFLSISSRRSMEEKRIRAATAGAVSVDNSKVSGLVTQYAAQPQGSAYVDLSTAERAQVEEWEARVAQNRLSSHLEKSRSDLGMKTDTFVPPPPEQTPMIARSASVTLLVNDFSASRNALDNILARHHAYAAELKATTVENVPRSLVAFLRVPANDLGPTLAELKGLGRLQEETQNGEEVTQQHIDLVARLKNSRETEQRLQAILAQRTGNMSDVLEVEQGISRVRGEIESMEGELKTLDHRVEFASVNLILNEEYQASMSMPPLSAGWRLRNAVVNGFRHAGETILGILLFLAEYGLSLAIWLAILIAPIYWLRRRYRRALSSV